MLTYKQIEDVNKDMQTLTITHFDKKLNRDVSKEYVPVNERILAFRKLCPNGRIVTEIVSHQDGMIVMRAAIFDGDGIPLSTGTAYEKEASSYINKTSYVENCETSAVGRAIGMLGVGIETSIDTYEGVTNAQQNYARQQVQEMEETSMAGKTASAKQVEIIKKNLSLFVHNIIYLFCFRINIFFISLLPFFLIIFF